MYPSCVPSILPIALWLISWWCCISDAGHDGEDDFNDSDDETMLMTSGSRR